MRILIADSCGETRRTTVLELERWGHTVFAVPDGLNAVALVAEAPDLNMIITEFEMPALNGLLAAESIEKLIPGMRIWLTTNCAECMYELREDAAECGVFVVMYKPELFQHLRKAHIIQSGLRNAA